MRIIIILLLIFSLFSINSFLFAQENSTETSSEISAVDIEIDNRTGEEKVEREGAEDLIKNKLLLSNRSQLNLNLLIPDECNLKCLSKLRERTVRDQNQILKLINSKKNEIEKVDIIGLKLLIQRDPMDIKILEKDIEYYKGLIESENKLGEPNQGLTSDYEANIKNAQERIRSLKNEITNNNQKLINYQILQNEVQNLDNDLFLITQFLLDVEDSIDNEVNREKANNKFRTTISLFFITLVAIIICGFYLIIIRNGGPELAKQLFEGEKGIQFITLFLIIIAIIFFGIMNILEGKELAALLGAISGYILGRTSKA